VFLRLRLPRVGVRRCRVTSIVDLFAAYDRLTVAAHPSVTDTHDGAACVTIVGHGWPSTCAAVGRGPDRATARAEALAKLARPLTYLRAVDALARHLRATRTLGADQVDTSPAHRADVLAAYHARAIHYEIARERVAQGGTDEDRAVAEWARIALYDAERAALRVA